MSRSRISSDLQDSGGRATYEIMMTGPSPSAARDLLDRGRFVARRPCSPLPRTTSAALPGLSEPGAVRKKNSPALSLGAVAAGGRGKRQGGAGVGSRSFRGVGEKSLTPKFGWVCG